MDLENHGLCLERGQIKVKHFFLFGHTIFRKFIIVSNQGIIPLFGAELFKTIKDKEKGSSSPIGHISSEVKLSMMEIRENKVRDLLAGGNNTKYKSVVKIREHPKRGFYGTPKN